MAGPSLRQMGVLAYIRACENMHLVVAVVSKRRLQHVVVEVPREDTVSQFSCKANCVNEYGSSLHQDKGRQN
eukprot:scaffold4290_cov264-Prasinococcus_capsulatus_cf.AAC.2